MNRTPKTVTIKSSDNDPVEGYEVKSATAKMITKSVVSNVPITFSAVDAAGKAITLNGKPSVTITPTVKKGEKVEVFNCGGGAGKLWN